jgi:hypothetical protein
MNATLTLFAMLSVVCGSAVVTYYISISRERLWLRSQKAEELYRMAEKAYVDGVAFFRARYDQSQMKVFPCVGNELAPLNEDVAELNILVGLYFPALTPELETATNALAVAFDMFRLAQASDMSNRERALDNLDLAVSNIRESFDQFKGAVLSCGRIDKGVKPAQRRVGAASRPRPQRAVASAY